MDLEERIQFLKNNFPKSDFRVPFNDARRILKSIEKEFIIAKDVSSDIRNLGQYHSDWAENIKRKIQLKTVPIHETSMWLTKLDLDKNYWLIVAFRDSPNTKHLIFDCKPNSLPYLISVSHHDFFIVDKKYAWFCYFNIDRKTKEVTIYKSGVNKTPFEM